MMKTKRYDAYKTSGVDWLGEIPAGWEVKRLGTYFKERKTKVSDKDFSPLSVTKLGVFPQWENVAKSNDGDNRKLVKAGDFVINSRSDRKGSSGIAYEDGSVSLINIVMSPQNVGLSFCNYLLKSNAFVEENYRIGHGIVADLWTTRYDEMKNIKITIPSEPEQTAIANYLDDKTAKIDQAIALKEQLIARLKERKQIIIQHAVTKGLDPDAPMKDSGVEWIGEIPAHWEVKKVRYCFSLDKGLSITKENLKETGIKCINYGEVHSKYGFEVNPKKHPLKCVDTSFLHSSPKSLLSYGDFVFADTSEDLEGSGNFSYLNSEELVFSGYHTVIARIKNNSNPRFIAYLFDSEIFRNQIRRRVKGVKVFSITQALLNNLLLWLPERSEQDKIVNILDVQSQKIDTAITQQQTLIDHLKEYKATLIDSAVTGKIKVYPQGK